MQDRDDPLALRLYEIADILVIPVEQFFNSEATPRQSDTDEYLRLWFGLRTEAGRAAGLNALRGIADREDG